MVKLFVGNLSDSIDSHRLKNLFLQFVQVQECDVLKNFAFVHVATEEDAELCIKKLHKTTLEGRELHLERSTSKLRKEPGMSDKCFTCGATDHKTPNCPQELSRRKRALNDDLSMGPDNKKPTVLPTINLAGTSASLLPQSTSWTSKAGNDPDPELQCPTNPELRTLYEQYRDARTKYFFYRERLSKELALQASIPVHVGRIDMTRTQPQSLIQNTPVLGANQMSASAPAMQYSASYQTPTLTSSVYSSGPQSLSMPPSLASYTTNRPVAYGTTTALQPSAISSSIVNQPAAPYNSMIRQAPLSSVGYASVPQQQSYVVQPQNGQQAPNQPYTNDLSRLSYYKRSPPSSYY